MDITNYLVELADQLDKQKLYSAANAVDKLIKTSSLNKVAQYVGAIGYILKNERAMQGCIRKKRTSEPKSTSMQSVIMGCLKEYQDGQKYDDTEWHKKYAEVIKVEPSLYKHAASSLANVTAEVNDIETHVDNLISAADVLAEAGKDDPFIISTLAELADVTEKLEKVAAPFEQKSRWYNKLWDWIRNKPGLKDVAVKIGNFRKELGQIRNAVSQALLAKRTIDHSLQVLVRKNPALQPKVDEYNKLDFQNPQLVQQVLDDVIATAGSVPGLQQNANKLVGQLTAVQRVNNLPKLINELEQENRIVNDPSQRSLQAVYEMGQLVNSVIANPMEIQLFDQLTNSVMQLNQAIMSANSQKGWDGGQSSWGGSLSPGGNPFAPKTTAPAGPPTGPSTGPTPPGGPATPPARDPVATAKALATINKGEAIKLLAILQMKDLANKSWYEEIRKAL